MDIWFYVSWALALVIVAFASFMFGALVGKKGAEIEREKAEFDARHKRITEGIEASRRRRIV